MLNLAFDENHHDLTQPACVNLLSIRLVNVGFVFRDGIVVYMVVWYIELLQNFGISAFLKERVGGPLSCYNTSFYPLPHGFLQCMRQVEHPILKS